MNQLAKRVAVITGGTSGIGLASAQLFLEEGAQVVLFARGEDGLSEARRSLGSSVHRVCSSWRKRQCTPWRMLASSPLSRSESSGASSGSSLTSGSTRGLAVVVTRGSQRRHTGLRGEALAGRGQAPQSTLRRVSRRRRFARWWAP